MSQRQDGRRPKSRHTAKSQSARLAGTNRQREGAEGESSGRHLAAYNQNNPAKG